MWAPVWNWGVKRWMLRKWGSTLLINKIHNVWPGLVPKAFSSSLFNTRAILYHLLLQLWLPVKSTGLTSNQPRSQADPMAEGPQDVLGTSPHPSRLNAFKTPQGRGCRFVCISSRRAGRQGTALHSTSGNSSQQPAPVSLSQLCSCSLSYRALVLVWETASSQLQDC